jgi:hypothetical protein
VSCSPLTRHCIARHAHILRFPSTITASQCTARHAHTSNYTWPAVSENNRFRNQGVAASAPPCTCLHIRILYQKFDVLCSAVQGGRPALITPADPASAANNKLTYSCACDVLRCAVLCRSAAGGEYQVVLSLITPADPGSAANTKN